MTDGFRLGACACGKQVTKIFKSGKAGKYCQLCMDRQAGRTKGTWCCGAIPCAYCSAPFSPLAAHQKFCSDRCRSRDRDRRESATGLPRADYLAAIVAQAAAKHAFTCGHCGKAAARRVGGTNAAVGYTNRYCSLTCRDVAYAAIALDARLRKGRHSKCFGLYCSVCTNPFVSRFERGTCGAACDERARARAVHRQAARTVRCADCGLDFCPMYGHSHVVYCHPCALSRQRAQRLAVKALRRARERAATVELVDPLVVFARDHWTCQLCTIATPRSKRGTYEPDAPELDHIIALAAGGEHSYRNTQCACRRCNGLKSDSPIEVAAARLIRTAADQQKVHHGATAEVDMSQGCLRCAD